MDKYFLFKGKDLTVTDKIIIHHPTLEEIFEFGEEKYHIATSAICAVPFDYKVSLYDAGIDYETLTDFDLFLRLIKSLDIDKTFIYFKDLDFSKFDIYEVNETNDLVLYNNEDDILIDRIVYHTIVDFIRNINHRVRNNDKAGNEHTKKYLIEKEKRKSMYRREEKYDNQLLDMVSAMTNNTNFKYKYHDVWSLPVYVFYDSMKSVNHQKSVDNLMTGIYTGNINIKEIPEKNLNWLVK